MIVFSLLRFGLMRNSFVCFSVVSSVLLDVFSMIFMLFEVVIVVMWV